LPGLKKKAQDELRDAKKRLETIGQPIDKITMIHHCQSVLNRSLFEEQVTPSMRVFQEAVHTTQKSITQEWVNERLKENVFTCPFFHGDKAFRTCLKDITDMWKPHVENLTNEVYQCLTKTMQSARAGTKGVSKTLWNKIQTKWMEDCPSLITEFRSKCELVLAQERDFGTMNHYLQEKYHMEEIMPDDFVEHLIKDLGLNNQIYAQFSASSMRHKLEKAKEEWVNIKRKRSLHEHLQPRLLAAVRAVWEVEKKTVTDVVLKMCRDSIINRVAYWVETQLLTDKDIVDAAVEDASLRETRKQLNTTIDNMEHVLKALGTIMKDISPSPFPSLPSLSHTAAFGSVYSEALEALVALQRSLHSGTLTAFGGVGGAGGALGGAPTGHLPPLL
jgi:hypothetical protein